MTTFLTAFLITLCAVVVWRHRHEIRSAALEPSHVAWSSPVDDTYFECPLPDDCASADVWETLAWIGSLPEVGARV